MPGIDGKSHSLADLAETPVVVVVFTCNTCDTARDYEDRIMAFHKSVLPIRGRRCAACAARRAQRQQGSRGFAGEDESPRRAARLRVSVSVRRLAEDCPAIRALTTPEFYVLDKDRKVAYLGAMDDKTEPQLAKVSYLNAAVDAVLGGKTPAKTSEPPRGCRITYKTDRELRAEKKQK